MKLDGLDHPKTLDFAARLDISLPQAIGHLELLWAFVAQKTPHGNVGKWADGAIARASHWTGEPTVFVTALCEAGFIEEHDEFRLIVHDWHEHAPRWVASKLSRAGQDFCRPAGRETPDEDGKDDSSEDDTGDSSGDYSPDSSAESKPSQAKSSQGKSSQGKKEDPGAEKFKPEDHTPEPLDPETWEAFCQFRRDLKKPIRTDKAVNLIAKDFARHALTTEQAQACVEHSMKNEYQGLFPEKFTNWKPAQPQSFTETDYSKGVTADGRLA